MDKLAELLQSTFDAVLAQNSRPQARYAGAYRCAVGIHVPNWSYGRDPIGTIIKNRPEVLKALPPQSACFWESLQAAHDTACSPTLTQYQLQGGKAGFAHEWARLILKTFSVQIVHSY